ncbi:MFS transporter [Streptomyces sp. NBC_01217]|uniref:MFS transporter n=1 Tax=Streptomyces sp. NBC_01217 TaxID=2903779 RepID=UPI002E108FF9|nr:MFS transporter [Streptomyces sp. NBC_01217]WSQ62551.1 MFS transporter [Streptomyces sp. NBC_01217]
MTTSVRPRPPSAFAVMVVGAAAGFRLLGHLSDRLGRRIIVPALGVGIVSAVVLAARPDLPGLIVGRLITGVAVGLMASMVTTYLSDLHHEAYPERGGSPVSAEVASVANLGGLAFGPSSPEPSPHGFPLRWSPATSSSPPP